MYPAAGLIDIAHQQGARIVGMNPDAEALDARMDIHIVAGAADSLCAVRAALGWNTDGSLR